MKTQFGKTKDGKEIFLYTLKNNNGMVAEFTNYGAILVSLYVRDKNGKLKDVVLGFDKLEDYFTNEQNFGATIGRNANRIGTAKFVLNDIEYKLDQNENNNNLHSGFDGYHKRVWDANVFTDDKGSNIEFTYHSVDMDQGFPGSVDISVIYTLTDENELTIEYNAVPTKDTIINMTNHSYFNLSNDDTILNHIVWINSDSITVLNNELIPTGEIREIKGTPMDFTAQKKIGRDINVNYDQLLLASGYDHNWILNKKDNEFSLSATLYHEESGILMEVYTDLPGIQFYTGNFLDESIGKNGFKHVKRSGVCFETQYFPNAINISNFKKPVTKAGEIYHTKTSYKFSVIVS